MTSSKDIINDANTSGVDNINRAGMAASIPMLLGLAAVGVEYFLFPEISTLTQALTFAGPTIFGLIEMARQLRIVNKISNEMARKVGIN